MVDYLNKVSLNPNNDLKRIPTRPINLRLYNFEENYDWFTVWNDAVRIDKNTVHLIGPPLNISPFLEPNNKQGVFKFKEEILPYQHVVLDRASTTIVNVSEYAKSIKYQNNILTLDVNISEKSWIFQNKKVIVTITKDHPISWLKQWIDYHKKIHNIDGYLLYNNQSSLYTSEQLELELDRNDITLQIVDYDVPFGAMGGDGVPWDSDFSQYVLLEHAKWKYLFSAKLAINCDTDELIYIKNNSLSDFADYCENSSNSAWIYNGTWIEPINCNNNIIADTVPFEDRYFKDYYKTSTDIKRGIGVK